MTTLDTRRDVYRGRDGGDFLLRRNAEAALKDGVETIVHAHREPSEPCGRTYTRCEFYVLDWHDEPEYDHYRQIAVIHPEEPDA